MREGSELSEEETVSQSGTKPYVQEDVVDDQYLMTFTDSQPEEVNVRAKAAGNDGVWSGLPPGALCWYQWKPIDWSWKDSEMKNKLDSFALCEFSLNADCYNCRPSTNFFLHSDFLFKI